MNRAELLIRYRWLMVDAEALIIQADRLFGLKELQKMEDPEADVIKDLEEYLSSLRRKSQGILCLCGRFEETLDLLPDDEKVICRKYYAIGMTDREIGDQLHADQSYICRKRKKALARLTEEADDLSSAFQIGQDILDQCELFK